MVTPEKKKNRDWILSQAKMICETETRNAKDIENDIVCWMYYYNKPDKRKYEYLMKRGNAQLPIYTVHIPCQRPIVDSLISQQGKRSWQFSTHAVDKQSIEAKYEAKTKAYIKAKQEEWKKRLDMYEEYVFQIQQQMQQIQSMLEVDPQSEEQAMQQQQLQQQLPMIQRQFEKAMKKINEEELLTQEKIEEIDNYYRYTYKDIREVLSQKLMSKIRMNYHVRSKGIEAIKHKTVTGREGYLVYCDEKTGEFFYEVLDMVNVKYPFINGVKYIQDGPWVSVVDTMSEKDLILQYGEELKKNGVSIKEDQIEKNNEGAVNGTFISTPGYGAIFTGELNEDNTIKNESGIRRERIWFKSNKEVKFKISKNQKEDAIVKEFIHMVPYEKELLDKKDYKYLKIEANGISKAYYVNRKNPLDRYHAETVELYDSEKENIITRYTQDRYSCTILNNMWVVDAKKDTNIVRSTDKHSKFNLPVFGKTFSSIADQPYSVIKNTIDLQDLYNSIYMLRQLAYAIAGAKGSTIDKSQKPDGMNMDEWEANIAQGRLYIQTVNKDGRRINSSFNQFTQFDNTVSSSVQYYDNVLMQIKETMGEIVGVPRQRQGQLVKGDLVGNTEIALEQSFLVTEIIYDEHDEIEAKALNELLMLYLKYGKIDNTYMAFNDKTEGEEIFYIPENLFKECDIELKVLNSNKEQSDIEFFKQLLQGGYQKGLINEYEISTLISIDSLKEMQKKTEEIIIARQKQMQQNQMEQIQQAGESQKDVLKFQNDLLMQAEQHKNLIEEKKVEIASFLAQLKAQTDQQNLLLKQYIEDKKHERELKAIDNESNVEAAYLVEQSKSTSVKQELEAIRTKFDMWLQTIQLQLQAKDVDNKHIESVEKIGVENKKVSAMKKRNPEHISDK